MIVSSHDLAEVERLADQIVIIDHGRTIATGTERELRARHGLGQQVELVTDAGTAGALIDALRPLCPNGVERADGPATTLVTCALPDDGPTLAHVLAAAGNAGVALRSVHTREDSLEDVFLLLTGRSLRE